MVLCVSNEDMTAGGWHPRRCPNPQREETRRGLVESPRRLRLVTSSLLENTANLIELFDCGSRFKELFLLWRQAITRFVCCCLHRVEQARFAGLQALPML